MNHLFIKNFHRDERVNHVEETHGADYYIGSRLTALRTIPVFERADPMSKLIKTVAKGGNVGTIYSYVKDKTGLVWWMLQDGGYVLHQQGYFDIQDALNTSSGKQIDADKALRESQDISNIVETSATKVIKGAGDLVGGAGDFLSDFGSNLKWIVIAVVFLGLIAVVIKFR